MFGGDIGAGLILVVVGLGLLWLGRWQAREMVDGSSHMPSVGEGGEGGPGWPGSKAFWEWVQRVGAVLGIAGFVLTALQAFKLI